MKFGTVLKIIFILCVGVLMADAMRGLVVKKEWKKAAGVTAAQDPHMLFGHIEEYHDTPLEMPSIEFETKEGNTLSLSQHRGKYVLLNAWATWCAPCVKELPALQNLKNKIAGDDWAVLAVSVDFNVSLPEIFEFAKDHEAEDVAGYADTSEKLEDMVMKVGGIPVTYILSPQGKIIARINGSALWDDEAVIAYLKGISKS